MATLLENKKEYFLNLIDECKRNCIWQSPKVFVTYICKSFDEKHHWTCFKKEMFDQVGIEFLDDSGGNAKYNKLIILCENIFNKQIIYFKRHIDEYCKKTNLGFSREQAKIKSHYFINDLKLKGYEIYNEIEYIDFVRNLAEKVLIKNYEKNYVTFLNKNFADGKKVLELSVSEYDFDKYDKKFFPHYKYELQKLSHKHENLVFFGGSKNDSKDIIELAMNEIKKETFDSFFNSLPEITKKCDFLNKIFFQTDKRKLQQLYNRKYNLTKPFVRLCQTNSVEERLDLIKKIINKRQSNGENTYTYIIDFEKENKHHITFLKKYFETSKSKNNLKKYHDFLNPLIGQRTSKTYKDMLNFALNTKSYTVWKKNHKSEYAYCLKSGRKWVTSIRIDCESIKPGWDDGKNKPKQNKK